MMVAAGLAASLGVALAPVSAPTATINATPITTYMVDDLQFVDGQYLGEFDVIRRSGKRAIGLSGAFYSEFTCWRGKIKNGRLKAAVEPFLPGESVSFFSRKVVGTGYSTKFKGTTLATRSEIIEYSGGFDPKDAMRSCRAWHKYWL